MRFGVLGPRLARAALTFAAGAAVVGSVAVGRLTTTPEANASGVGTYTLRMGDRITVPAVGQTCVVASEGGFPELFCARSRHPQHQVAFFRDRILIGKVGNPDRVAWSGKP